LKDYTIEHSSGLWSHHEAVSQSPLALDVNIAMKLGSIAVYSDMDEEIKFYESVMEEARGHVQRLSLGSIETEIYGEEYGEMAWFYVPVM